MGEISTYTVDEWNAPVSMNIIDLMDEISVQMMDKLFILLYIMA